MSIDLDARAMAETASIGVAEVKREVKGLHEKLDDLKRSNKNTPLIVGAIVTLGTLVIGGVTQFQVASIGALKAEQATHAQSTLREDEVRAIENRVASKLDGLRTELEQQRRGYAAPLQRDPDVVAANRR